MAARAGVATGRKKPGFYLPARGHRLMRTLLCLVLVTLLSGCASVPTHVAVLDPSRRFEPTQNVVVLLRPPERRHVEIAKLESRGAIGEPETALIEDAREKAKALGAHAIVTLETLTQYHPPITVWDPWPPPYPWYRDRWTGMRFWPYGPGFPFGEERVLPGGNVLTLRAVAIRFED